MRKESIIVIVLIIFIMACSYVSANPVAEALGVIILNNVNGELNASASNTLTVTFNNPSDSSGSGGGGNGNGGVIPEENASSTNLDDLELAELLATVSPSELGFENLSTSKMKVEKINTSIFLKRESVDSLIALRDSLSDENAKAYIQALIDGLNEELLNTVSVFHSSDLFIVKSIYSNKGTYVNRTRVTITVGADTELKNIRILEVIPTIPGVDVSDFIFTSSDASLIADNPFVFEWKISSLKKGESQILRYYIADSVDLTKFKTFVLAEGKFVDDSEITGDVVEKGPLDTVKDAWKNTFTKKRSPLWALVFFFMIIIIVGFVAYKHQDQIKQLIAKKQVGAGDLVLRPDLVVPYEKVLKLETFIESQYRQGRNDAEIRRELLSIGWDEHVVDVIMHDVHVVDENLEKLDGFIKKCLDNGLTLEKIKISLKNIGWREDIIDLALDDFR